jgi:formate dehydrogenase major subunit
VAALAESFGRGAMSNHWIDIKNSDCILIMGSNAAENHPVSFKYITQAQLNGATLISVDPRFTRTSSRADIYASLRSGTDIAFLGGMIKYIIDNELYQKDYVIEYTNAAFIVNKSFDFADGLFSGYDSASCKYDNSNWSFETDEHGLVKKDTSLEHPRCVFALLKKHYSRYSIEVVSSITGTPKKDLLSVYKAFAATGQSFKAGTILYAMGWTQHSVGVQNIRCGCIIQLLLGNMGIAGGGINALRGESNVQGSTDHALLWHILPGYLKVPRNSDISLQNYNNKYTPSGPGGNMPVGWQNYPRYSISLLKAFFGEKASAKNQFGYQWLPKADNGKTYSWVDIFDEMHKGSIKGFFAWGMNPACSGANANKVRNAMKNLDWMVNTNIFDNETGSFWRGPGMDPSAVKTEVFFLPACVSVEKEGSITNSGRWTQWRYRGPRPLGNSMPDGDIILLLGRKLKQLFASEGGVFPEPVLNLKWDYDSNGKYDPHKVAKQINGYFHKDLMANGKLYPKGSLVPNSGMLASDGSTSSGNWLYCGSYTEEGNMAARRDQKDAPNHIGLYPGFAWCWPDNRRILYSRASVDANGNPWDDKRWVVRWDGRNWIGDIPDGQWPSLGSEGNPENPVNRPSFAMTKEKYGRLFGPGLVDGPFPEHYEPVEGPLAKNLLGAQLINPTVSLPVGPEDALANADPKFPYVCTTYRVSEHWQTGVITRHLPWLMELMPQMFVEISHQLASLKDIKNGSRVKVISARGSVEATAIVTRRFNPFIIDGKIVHQVGVPWHFGWQYPASGKEESANLLTSFAVDPNTNIPESKAFMVNISKI